MTRLIAVVIACMFALNSGFAVAAAHAGAKPMDKKDEMKKDDTKKDAKKTSKKKKKDEMKK